MIIMICKLNAQERDAGAHLVLPHEPIVNMQCNDALGTNRLGHQSRADGRVHPPAYQHKHLNVHGIDASVSDCRVHRRGIT